MLHCPSIAPSLPLTQVGQRAYTPLYTRPIEWLTTRLGAEEGAATAEEREAREQAAARSVASLAAELRLGLGEADTKAVGSDEAGSAGAGEVEGAGEAAGAGEGRLSGREAFVTSLLKEHEDWGGAMSGGQRIKLELIRSVFLSGVCPEVWLLDLPQPPASTAPTSCRVERFRCYSSTRPSRRSTPPQSSSS